MNNYSVTYKYCSPDLNHSVYDVTDRVLAESPERAMEISTRFLKKNSYWDVKACLLQVNVGNNEESHVAFHNPKFIYNRYSKI